MPTDYTFTTQQLLFVLANWALQPLTLTELNHMLKYLSKQDTHTYALDDAESLILEILSDIGN